MAWKQPAVQHAGRSRRVMSATSTAHAQSKTRRRTQIRRTTRRH